MLEDVENKGYISPDAYIQFRYEPGCIRRQYGGGEFTITDTLQGKIENIFKKLCSFYLQFFFRDVVVNQRLNQFEMPDIEREDSEIEAVEAYEDDEE